MTFSPLFFFYLPSSSLQTLTNLVDHVLGTSGPKMVHHAVRLAGRHGVVQDDRAEGNKKRGERIRINVCGAAVRGSGRAFLVVHSWAWSCVCSMQISNCILSTSFFFDRAFYPVSQIGIPAIPLPKVIPGGVGSCASARKADNASIVTNRL